MATLSDTPTQTVLTSTSEAGGVSIKIEQDVLPGSEDFADGSGLHSVDNTDIQTKTAYELSTIEMENFPNGMGGNFMSAFNISHSIFQENIKTEPSVDIDDRHPEGDEEVEENSSFESQSNEKIISPKIRLTPTSKLIATPNSGTENKRRYVCPYENCTKSYGKSSHLRSHLTWHTGIKPFVCKEPGCGKGFTRSDELNRHIRTHTGEKPFECVQCTKKFSRSDHLTKHLATHTKQLVSSNKLLAKKTKMYQPLPQTNLPAEVPTINKDEYNNVSLNNSFPKNGLAESNDCKVFTNLKELEQKNELKIKLENPDYDDTGMIATKWDRPESSSSLAGQIAEANIKVETNITVKPEPLFENRITQSHNQSFEDEPDDDAIMPEANLPPLIQDVKPLLKRSTDAIHDPTRPHPCSQCIKSFKRQDDLNRHMRTHTGEKPFACTECEKRFMRSDHLKKHMNTHIRMYKTRMLNESPAEAVPPLAAQPPIPSIKLEHGV